LIFGIYSIFFCTNKNRNKGAHAHFLWAVGLGQVYVAFDLF
jgi:hypothetical protein